MKSCIFRRSVGTRRGRYTNSTHISRGHTLVRVLSHSTQRHQGLELADSREMPPFVVTIIVSNTIVSCLTNTVCVLQCNNIQLPMVAAFFHFRARSV
jgi:hypothetical protein